MFNISQQVLVLKAGSVCLWRHWHPQMLYHWQQPIKSRQGFFSVLILREVGDAIASVKCTTPRPNPRIRRRIKQSGRKLRRPFTCQSPHLKTGNVLLFSLKISYGIRKWLFWKISFLKVGSFFIYFFFILKYPIRDWCTILSPIPNHVSLQTYCTVDVIMTTRMWYSSPKSPNTIWCRRVKTVKSEQRHDWSYWTLLITQNVQMHGCEKPSETDGACDKVINSCDCPYPLWADGSRWARGAAGSRVTHLHLRRASSLQTASYTF